MNPSASHASIVTHLLPPYKKKVLCKWHGSLYNILMSNSESRSVSSTRRTKEMKPSLLLYPVRVVDFPETQRRDELLKALHPRVEIVFSDRL